MLTQQILQDGQQLTDADGIRNQLFSQLGGRFGQNID